MKNLFNFTFFILLSDFILNEILNKKVHNTFLFDFDANRLLYPVAPHFLTGLYIVGCLIVIVSIFYKQGALGILAANNLFAIFILSIFSLQIIACPVFGMPSYSFNLFKAISISAAYGCLILDFYLIIRKFCIKKN